MCILLLYSSYQCWFTEPPRLQQTEEGTKSRGYEAAATNTVVLDQGVYFIII